MPRGLKSEHQSWPLSAPFRISRGVKVSAEVVAVEVRQGDRIGRGESVPYARYGETVDSVLAELRGVEAAVAAGATREALDGLLPAGAARNALDCALWDLEAQAAGRGVAELLGAGPLPPLTTALTVGLDTPERMEAAAAAIAGAALIKIKVSAEDPAARIRAVRAAAPAARLIVDPNESWDLPLLAALQPVLAETAVTLVEQPLPAEADAALEGFEPVCAICADESCHVADDLPRLRQRYQAVNIKLDKTGGLSEALRLLEAARRDGFQVMVGCMVCTSLGIVPALHVARHADFVDLDGPWWLRRDHPGGLRFEQGTLFPPAPGFWGEPAAARSASMA